MIPKINRVFQSRIPHLWIFGLWLALLVAVSLACARGGSPAGAPWAVSRPTEEGAHANGGAASAPTALPAFPRSGPILTPTPDLPHELPGLRADDERYVVQPGDTLGIIARRYNLSLEILIQVNELTTPDILEIGQVLTIPAPAPGESGPGFKIIPDSEMVYSPATVGFDVRAFAESRNGYLLQYEEEVEGRALTGPQIVERVAKDFSVNPRLLLAILEYRSGWVTQAQPDASTLEYPLMSTDTWRMGLYRQLAWAANNLNRGYYLWRVNGIAAWTLPNGDVVPVDSTINAGTAGVQYLFSLVDERAAWTQAVTETGLFSTYQAFFGYPFLWAFEPLLPVDLWQPKMQLPFEPVVDWAFTGGPHGGWGDGSAWAALDFAPPGSGLGCVSSDAWVVAVVDGPIVRSDQGAVVQDVELNGAGSADGLEQTGWVILYMHVEARDRVQAGVTVRAGERLGHPSCEGGVSTGTHLHLARRYNGEWIPADGPLPFVLDQWVSRGAGKEYDGFLVKGDVLIEAWEGYLPENLIRR